MTRETAGKLLFLGATALALAFYGLTAPSGLPWNRSSHLALAYLGEIVRLPAMPHPIWGFYVQVFGGSVALAIAMASVAAGLLGAIVNRYAGWRVAAAVSILWIFLPPVWNRAITGERSVVLLSVACAALWALNAIGLWTTQKARAWRKAWRKTSGGLIEAALPAEREGERRRKVARLVGWIVLGAAGVFALVSLKFHDCRLGEAASAFAQGVVDAAHGRVIVMNGLCDDQVVRSSSVVRRSSDAPSPVVRRSSDAPSPVVRRSSDAHLESCGAGGRAREGTSTTGAWSALSLRGDDAYRTNLIAWVRRTFPTETNLWIAAEVGSRAFVTAAVKIHPEKFYLMNGGSATCEEWERRWKAFQPYLDSSDPFVPTARRLFAREGNAVGNALDLPAAWRLYKLIYEEVDPGNISALVNMNEMIRAGYPASGSERLLIEKRLAHFFEDGEQRRRVREAVRAAGSVRADPAVLAKMADEARARIAARVAAGEPVAPSPEAMTLAEWHNEMIVLMNRGETEKAGRLARYILTNPKWRGHIPANAVMGGVMAKEGNYSASESFYRTATATTNRIPARVRNGCADTLLHLGKLGAAEAMARRAVAETDEKFWMARLTLAEVLWAKAEKADGVGDLDASGRAEIRALLKTVPSAAPAALREKARKMLREIGR